MAFLRDYIDRIETENERLQAENAKLRELAENLMIAAGMEREEIMAALQRLMNVVKG